MPARRRSSGGAGSRALAPRSVRARRARSVCGCWQVYAKRNHDMIHVARKEHHAIITIIIITNTVAIAIAIIHHYIPFYAIITTVIIITIIIGIAIIVIITNTATATSHYRFRFCSGSHSRCHSHSKGCITIHALYARCRLGYGICL